MNMILNSTINAPTTQQNDRDVLRGEADKRAEDAGADADFTDEACSSDCDEPEATVPSASDSAFDRSFNSFDPSQKWRLASGRVVEDVLNDHYLEVRSDHVGHLVRDWVIDLENMTMKRWFTVEEWQEIMDAVPTLPPPTREFAQSLTRFHGVKTAEALRKVVMSTSFLPEGVSFNREAHFDLEWAHLVVHEFLRICETDSETIIVADQLEQWYCYHLWFLFDKLFLSLPRIILVRRESTCRASSLRKNRNRTETTARAKLGRRFDGILRSVEDHSHEFGALEAARQLPGGTETTKWMSDCRKLGRALRDMLSRLHEVVGHEPGVFEKLQVVGIFTAGRELRMCRMCHPKGYLCLLKWEGTHTFPTSVPQLQQLLMLLAHVVQMKGVVARTVDAVRSQAQAPSAEALFEAIMQVGTKSNRPTLPWAADSP